MGSSLKTQLHEVGQLYTAMSSDSSTTTYALILLGAVVYLLKWFRNSRVSIMTIYGATEIHEGVQFRAVPTVGPSAPLLSYLGAVRYVGHAREMLEEGYTKVSWSVPYREESSSSVKRTVRRKAFQDSDSSLLADHSIKPQTDRRAEEG